MNASSPPPSWTPQREDEERRKRPAYERASDFILDHGPRALMWLALFALSTPFWSSVGGFLDGHNGAVSALAAIAVAWFTLALWRSTDKLWQASESQRRELELAKEQELRGYVFFHKRGEFTPPRHALTIRFKNSGATPVKNVEVFGYHSLIKDDDTSPLPTDRRATDSFRAVIAPEGEIDVHFRWEFNDNEMRHRLLPAYTRYVHGFVKYVDAFGRTRHTHFRYWMHSEDLRICTEGNDWT